MPVNPIEGGVGDLWVAKQPTLGTAGLPTATGITHLKIASGGLKPAKTTGSEEAVDGSAFGSPSPYTDTLGGDTGEPVVQAQIETAGLCFAYIVGIDIVTGTTPDFTHTIVVGTANPVLLTFHQKMGSAVGPVRQRYYDSQLSKLTWNAGQSQKIAHLSLGVMSLNAAETYAADPTVTDSGTDPFQWPEVAGQVSMDGTVLPEIESETLEVDRKTGVHRGDSAKPACFLPGKGGITRGFAGLITDGTLQFMSKTLYGTTTPPANTGSATRSTRSRMVTKYVRSSVRSLQISTPRVTINPGDFEMFALAEGGKRPVTFTGDCLKDGATSQLTVVAKTGDATSYV